MPFPLLPLLALLGAAGVAATITYYVTSNRAKQNATVFREKAVRALELLKERVASMETKHAELKDAARRAHARAADAHAERDVWERRAREAEAVAAGLREELDHLRAERSRYERDVRAADMLVEASTGSAMAARVRLTVAAVRLSPALAARATKPASAASDVEAKTLVLDEQTTAALVRASVALADITTHE